MCSRSTPGTAGSARLLPEEEAAGQHDPRLDALTPRELEVLRLVATGLTNIEIAEALHLSTTTVKTHTGNLLAELGLRDRVQLVIFAYESGLVGG